MANTCYLCGGLGYQINMGRYAGVCVLCKGGRESMSIEQKAKIIKDCIEGDPLWKDLSEKKMLKDKVIEGDPLWKDNSLNEDGTKPQTLNE